MPVTESSPLDSQKETMITEMIICVTDTNVECHPTIQLFQIIFHIGTILNDKINNIQIAIACIGISSIIQPQ